jgi:hypothetical protein
VRTQRCCAAVLLDGCARVSAGVVVVAHLMDHCRSCWRCCKRPPHGRLGHRRY